MTDHPTPSAEALAKADAICKQHGMLPGGYMRDSLAEALEAFAAKAVEESWLPRCGETGKRSVNGICPEHGGDGCLMASARLESTRDGFSAAVTEFVTAVKAIAGLSPNTWTQTWPPAPLLFALLDAEWHRVNEAVERAMRQAYDNPGEYRRLVRAALAGERRVPGPGGATITAAERDAISKDGP